jgi:hypothetical protein
MCPFVDFQFVDPISDIFADLKLPQISGYIIFLLTNTGLTCSNSNMYRYIIEKNLAKQTCGQILGGFAMKGPKRGQMFLKIFFTLSD